IDDSRTGPDSGRGGSGPAFAGTDRWPTARRTHHLCADAPGSPRVHSACAASATRPKLNSLLASLLTQALSLSLEFGGIVSHAANPVARPVYRAVLPTLPEGHIQAWTTFFRSSWESSKALPSFYRSRPPGTCSWHPLSSASRSSWPRPPTRNCASVIRLIFSSRLGRCLLCSSTMVAA